MAPAPPTSRYAGTYRPPAIMTPGYPARPRSATGGPYRTLTQVRHLPAALRERAPPPARCVPAGSPPEYRPAPACAHVQEPGADPVAPRHQRRHRPGPSPVRSAASVPTPSAAARAEPTGRRDSQQCLKRLVRAVVHKSFRSGRDLRLNQSR